MRVARRLGLTTKEYVWIATQPVIGADKTAPLDFPPGMLGVHFDTDTKASVTTEEVLSGIRNCNIRTWFTTKITVHFLHKFGINGKLLAVWHLIMVPGAGHYL